MFFFPIPSYWVPFSNWNIIFQAHTDDLQKKATTSLFPLICSMYKVGTCCLIKFTVWTVLVSRLCPLTSWLCVCRASSLWFVEMLAWKKDLMALYNEWLDSDSASDVATWAIKGHAKMYCFYYLRILQAYWAFTQYPASVTCAICAIGNF